ncbi:MAG: rRNA maturation RNase YbeY [Candidatus Omnitrophica bacterium]|nr:rRNA maturation RNase YbeY [Candidatus Omnitrophota bacterium]
MRQSPRQSRVKVPEIRRVAGRILKEAGCDSQYLSVLLTDDARMAKIHQRWLGTLEPTDVLSFSQRGPASPAKILGDVAISVQTAFRLRGPRVREEVIRYLVHGILHLLGYRHDKPKDRRRMERFARRLEACAA